MDFFNEIKYLHLFFFVQFIYKKKKRIFTVAVHIEFESSHCRFNQVSSPESIITDDDDDDDGHYSSFSGCFGKTEKKSMN